MPALEWDNWFRSEGLRNETNGRNFGGKTWATHVHEGMQKVFLGPNPTRTLGVLYSGAVFEKAEAIVVNNGRMLNFDRHSLEGFLKFGDFKYTGPRVVNTPNGPITARNPPLTLEGGPSDKSCFTQIHGDFAIEVNIQLLEDFSRTVCGGPNTSAGEFAQWFLGACVIMQMIRQAGFGGVPNISYETGSDFLSSLPGVGYWSTVLASPYRDCFANGATGDGAGGVVVDLRKLPHEILATVNANFPF